MNSDAVHARTLIRVAAQSVRLGLNRGTSGNLSAREGTDRFLITRSGVALDDCGMDDLVHVNMDATAPVGGRRPSAEWRIHRDVYAARPEIGAVLHTHSPFATTVACLGRALPAVHYGIAIAGGPDVRCTEYAAFGTEELSRAALRALEDRRACLLANHGMIALGTDPDDALAVALEVESVAEYWWRASAVGRPAILTDEQVSEAVSRYEDYRRRSGPG